MPSTVVHVAVGGIVAAALLGPAFRGRTLLVVLAAAALPDLDTILGIWLHGGHRALLHTLLFPAALAGLLVWDARTGSRLRERYGPAGVRTAWVAVAAVLFAGIGPDLFTNGVNALYPAVDTFYSIEGRAVLSDQRGFVQTFVELQAPEPVETHGTTNTTHYTTGFDTRRGEDPESVERVFPLVTSGWQLMLVVLGAALPAARLADRHRDQ